MAWAKHQSLKPLKKLWQGSKNNLLRKFQKNKGFTLIELLVVISIIGFLATLALVSVANARKKARTTKRLSDIRQIQKALELYYSSNNNTYPSTALAWASACPYYGGTPPNNVIPGLVPTYMAKMPVDPLMTTGPANCYLYKSDGTDYLFVAYFISEYTAADYLAQPSFMLPGFDNGSNICTVDGVGPFAWGGYSPGAACWQ